MQIPDKAIPRDLLSACEGNRRVPAGHQGSVYFWRRGRAGRREPSHGTGWSDPVFFRAGGGSVGPQIGVSATDFVLLFMNDEAVERADEGQV